MIELTDAEVREHWVETMMKAVPMARDMVEGTYDSWLAEHDRKVMEKAWDAGRASMFMDINHDLETSNPHRKQEEE